MVHSGVHNTFLGENHPIIQFNGRGGEEVSFPNILLDFTPTQVRYSFIYGGHFCSQHFFNHPTISYWHDLFGSPTGQII